MAATDDVRQASDRFYAALTAMCNGQSAPMDAVWSHGADVTAMHPIGTRGAGWEQVQGQFAQVASSASGGQVRLAEQLICVGSDLAYETGVEMGSATLAGERFDLNHRVTNVYRREGGEWKMVHHHADFVPQMNDFLSRLQPPA